VLAQTEGLSVALYLELGEFMLAHQVEDLFDLV
jgi:hypothetical protein